MNEVLHPGDLVWVAPDTGLYPTWDEEDDDDTIINVEDWTLALVIGTDHVHSQVGQHPWFMLLIKDSLRYAPRHNLMTMAATPSSVQQRQR